MTYCNHCGSQVDDNAKVCMNCGFAINAQDSFSESKTIDSKDSESFWWAVLGFALGIMSCIGPIVGLCLYVTLNKSRPKLSKRLGLGTLIGFILEIIYLIIRIALYE